MWIRKPMSSVTVTPAAATASSLLEWSSFVPTHSNVSLEAATNRTFVRPFSDIDIVISCVVILVLMIVSILANVITIVVITTTPKLKNMFMIFIVSLCVSDLYSSMISWIFLYRRTWGFEEWDPMPRAFCKFYWGSELMTNYVTAWHILAFGILRYLCCRFPFHFSKILKKKLMHVKILIASIWIVSFLVGFIPFVIFFEVREIDRFSGRPSDYWPTCTISEKWLNQEILYHSICYPLFFYTPIACMIVVAILLCITLWKNSGRSQRYGSQNKSTKKLRREQQAIFQVLLVVFSYLIGYIPFTAYGLWTVQDRGELTLYNRQFDYWFGMIQYFFLRFSECLNPFFYNLGSSKMRFYTKKFIKQKLFCCLFEEKFFQEQSDTTPSPQMVPVKESPNSYKVTGTI